MSRKRGDYPVGIPLVPPAGWRGRPVTLWRPVLAAGLVTVMVLLCVMAGWLSVEGLPQRPKRPPDPLPEPEPVAPR